MAKKCPNLWETSTVQGYLRVLYFHSVVDRTKYRQVVILTGHDLYIGCVIIFHGGNPKALTSSGNNNMQ